jgi:ribA/ribD-fused uncharacterized protein
MTTNPVEDSTHIYFYPGYLSNFHRCQFKIDDITFSTSEQAFMYEKAKLMGDPVIADKILKADAPQRAKYLGGQIKPWDQALWDKHKVDIMYKVVYQKFSQNHILQKKLLATGSKTLVEAAANDRIWGIGISVEDAKNNRTWRGQNLLGKVLMDVRWNLAETIQNQMNS